jgi:hypothetical protein
MASIINTVRATVLSVANKNNFGYITPNDFNLYAKQAQLDIFEDYFYQYNSWLVKQNARVSGSGYADIVKGIVEVLDSFSSTKGLINSGVNLYDLPNDYYLMDKINYYPTIIKQGTTTGNGVNTLTDSTATFQTTGTVLPGQLITNTTKDSVSEGSSAYIVSVVSETELSLSANIFGSVSTIGDGYSIVSTSKITEIERVSQNKIFYLKSSPLTKPSISFPAYVLGGANSISTGNTITVYPETIKTLGTIVSQYVRYPKDPKWTYVSLTGGEPVFDEGPADYQDFELPLSDQTNLVNKILQYAGVSIRDASIVQFAIGEENEANQQEG